MSNPKITIIIPCYNRVNLVKKTVFSALDQSYENLQIIGVDNESIDETPDFLNQISIDYKKSFTFLTAKNIYPNCHDECLEEAFKILDGEYFTILGSDDLIHKDYIKNNAKFLSENQNIDCWQSDMHSINETDQIFGDETTHRYSSLKEFKNLCLNTGSPVNTPTVFYKSKIVHSGLFQTNPKEFGGAADYDLYCSLADKNIFIKPANKNFGYFYRWHSDQATWNVHRENCGYPEKIKQKWKNLWVK